MTDKPTRDQIVDAADQLFYRQGYEHTSFADIAEAVSISRGNFYYHFKSKDEILDAVIAARLARTQQLLDRWELEGKTPVERVRSFIAVLIDNRSKIRRYGCPDGTLCTELAKLGHGAHSDAKAVFALYRAWLGRQLAQLGREADADALAMHLLARCQGVAALANAFHDEAFIRHELEAMYTWLDTVARDRRATRRGRSR